MNKYNLDKLIKVSCNGFIPAFHYSFKKQKKFLGFITQEEGFYTSWGNFIGKNVPDNHVLIDDVLYEKPKVTLYYQDDFSKEYLFDNPEEAEKFFEEITATGRWKS